MKRLLALVFALTLVAACACAEEYIGTPYFVVRMGEAPENCYWDYSISDRSIVELSGEEDGTYRFEEIADGTATIAMLTVESEGDYVIDAVVYSVKIEEDVFTEFVEIARGCKFYAVESNPSTGYMWNYEVADESVAIIAHRDFVPDTVEEGVVGAGGMERFFIAGVAPGSVDINIRYARAWEDEALYEDVISVVVAEDLTVTIAH